MNNQGNEKYLCVAKSFLKAPCKSFPKGSIVFPKNGAAIGTNKKRILFQPSIVDLNTAVLIPNDDLLPEFLLYWISHIDFREITRRGAIPTLDIAELKQKTIPYNSRAEQERIVAELDLLTEIIDKQKAQLKELDILAQSIFYDMFGDPVENEKGWDVKKLNEIVADTCTISYGIVQPGDGVEDGVPIVRPVDLTGTFVNTSNLKKTTKEISESYSRTILAGEEILVCVRGTTGMASMASPALKGCNVTRGITPLLFGDAINKWFVYFQLQTASIRHIIDMYTKGITLKQINMADLRNIPLIIPPLSLQQSFADKINAIEQQKAAITQSIAETQKLFDYTMDKYFG